MPMLWLCPSWLFVLKLELKEWLWPLPAPPVFLLLADALTAVTTVGLPLVMLFPRFAVVTVMLLRVLKPWEWLVLLVPVLPLTLPL